MINPQEYADFVDTLDALIAKARRLGLYRTAKKIHKAVTEARSETFEAMPQNVPVVKFIIGPIREQR